MSALRWFVVGLLLVMAAGTWSRSHAAVPGFIHYQGVLTNPVGDPITSMTSVVFTIYDAPSVGNVKWTETRNVTPDSEGRFAILLGQATPFHDTVFESTPLFLGVQVGADPELTPRSVLASAPFAFRSATVDGTTGGTITGEVIVLTDGSGSGVGIRDPGGNIGGYTPTHAAFTDVNNDTITQIGTTGLYFTEPASNDTILGYDPTLNSLELGLDNTATGQYSVAIGSGNSTPGANAFAIGTSNRANSANDFAVGTGNTATGGNSFASGLDDSASGWTSAVLGGWGNHASGDQSIIAGGNENRASGHGSIVVGGSLNEATHYWSVVCGGVFNVSSGYEAFVAGGEGNVASGDLSTITGGSANQAGGIESVVGGGGLNIASGSNSAIPGGVQNQAAGYASLASGFRAKSNHGGTYVWADTIPADFASTAGNQYLIRASGGVGIGTASTPSQLTVYEGGDDATQTTFTQGLSSAGLNIVTDYVNGNYTPGMFWSTQNNNSTRPKAGIYLRETSLGTEMRFGTSNSYTVGITNDAMTIDHTGEIGIGETAPTRILHVVQGSATDPVADAWTLHSSIRWKKNVETVTGAVAKIEKLRGVYYDEKSTDKHCLGLIAEEVGNVVPEIVDYEENGVDAQSVDYARLVALLIEGMKEQQWQLNAQTVEIEELKRAVTP